jgi:hypothetical protein
VHLLVRDTLDYMVDLTAFASDEKALHSEPPPPRSLNYSEWNALKKQFVAGRVFFPPPPTTESPADVPTKVLDVELQAETFLWWHNWQQGLGPWRPHNAIPAPADVLRPEVAIITTTSALTAEDKPAIRPPKAPRVRNLQLLSSRR